MSTTDALLVGGLGTAIVILIAYGVVIAIRKTWGIVSSLTAALKEIAKLREANQQLVSIAKQVVAELSYLRQIMTGGKSTESPQPEQAYQPWVQPKIPEYPTPDFSRFRVKEVPDAKPEDTDMEALAQTDEDLTNIERLETLRQMGMDMSAHEEEEKE